MTERSIPSHKQCVTAIQRVESAQRGRSKRGYVSDPVVRADIALREARVYLGRIAAYRELNDGYAPVEYINEVHNMLRLAARQLDGVMS